MRQCIKLGFFILKLIRCFAKAYNIRELIKSNLAPFIVTKKLKTDDDVCISTEGCL